MKMFMILQSSILRFRFPVVEHDFPYSLIIDACQMADNRLTFAGEPLYYGVIVSDVTTYFDFNIIRGRYAEYDEMLRRLQV